MSAMDWFKEQVRQAAARGEPSPILLSIDVGANKALFGFCGSVWARTCPCGKEARLRWSTRDRFEEVCQACGIRVILQLTPREP